MTPQLIQSVTDGSIMELYKTVKKTDKPTMYHYRYIKSETKLGKISEFTAKDLDNMIQKGIFVEIKPTT
jgi:hypothetical protein